MEWKTLASALFGHDHGITQDGDFLHGSVSFDRAALTVIGTTNHAPIGVRLALIQARAVLDTMARHPGRPILLLIDTPGQQLRRRDGLAGCVEARVCEARGEQQGCRKGDDEPDAALAGGIHTRLQYPKPGCGVPRTSSCERP